MFKCCQVSFNAHSCQRTANKTLNISVGGMLVNQVSSVHYLEVTIDPMEFACS